MSKPFYNALIDCTDQDKETKVCATDRWKSEDSPYEMSEESTENQGKSTTFKRLRITLKKKVEMKV